VATSSPAASQPAAGSLSGCPAARPLSSLTPLATLAGGADDTVATPQGDIWVSEHDGGEVVELDPQGTVLRSFADPEGPEGIEPLPDGKLLVAQQAPDRIDLLDPATSRFSTWLQLEPAAAGTGIDGLGVDGTTLLVPDSAGGRLLRVPLDGDAAGPPVVVATGLGRPVSAWPLQGGYVVAVENTPGLVRLSAAGAHTPLVHEQSDDDVVERDGIVYATNLAADRLEAIDPATGAERVLVSASPDPQGLAIAPGGMLLLVDEERNVLAALPSCG
jgi:streptogramin lyase